MYNIKYLKSYKYFYTQRVTIKQKYNFKKFVQN